MHCIALYLRNHMNISFFANTVPIAHAQRICLLKSETQILLRRPQTCNAIKMHCRRCEKPVKNPGLFSLSLKVTV